MEWRATTICAIALLASFAIFSRSEPIVDLQEYTPLSFGSLQIIPNSLGLPYSSMRRVYWLEAHAELDEQLAVTFHVRSSFPVDNAMRLKFVFGPKTNPRQFACLRVRFYAVVHGVVGVVCDIRVAESVGSDMSFSVWEDATNSGEWSLIDHDNNTLFTLVVSSRSLPRCLKCPLVETKVMSKEPELSEDAMSFATIIRAHTQIGQAENLMGSLQFHRPEALLFVYVSGLLCDQDVQLRVAAWRNVIVREVLCLRSQHPTLRRFESAYAVTDAFAYLENLPITQGARDNVFLVSSNVEVWRRDFSQFTNALRPAAPLRTANSLTVDDVRTRACSRAVHGLSRATQLPAISKCLVRACPRSECSNFSQFIPVQNTTSTPDNDDFYSYMDNEDVDGECVDSDRTSVCLIQQPRNEPTFYMRPVSYGQPFRSLVRKRRPFFVLLVGIDRQLEVLFRVFEYWAQVMPCDPELDVDGSGDAGYPYQRPALVITILPDLDPAIQNQLKDKLNLFPQVRQCFSELVFFNPKDNFNTTLWSGVAPRAVNLTGKYSHARSEVLPRILYEDTTLSPLLRDHDYFLWMELDVLPLRSRWLQKLYRETALDSEPFWAKGSVFAASGVDPQHWRLSQLLGVQANALWSTHHEFARFIRSQHEVGKWLEGNDYPHGAELPSHITDYVLNITHSVEAITHWPKFRFVQDFINLDNQGLVSVREFQEFFPSTYFVYSKYRLPCNGYPLTFTATDDVITAAEDVNDGIDGRNARKAANFFNKTRASFLLWHKEWESDADNLCGVPRNISQRDWCGFSRSHVCPDQWPQPVTAVGLVYRDSPDLSPSPVSSVATRPSPDVGGSLHVGLVFLLFFGVVAVCLLVRWKRSRWFI